MSHVFESGKAKQQNSNIWKVNFIKQKLESNDSFKYFIFRDYL